MDTDFLSLAYAVLGPEAFAYALIAGILAAWRKWIRSWTAHLLYLLPFVLVWPLITAGYKSLQTGPVPPDVAFLGPWVSIGAAVFWAYLVKELMQGVGKPEQHKSPWWAHLAVLGGVFIFVAMLSPLLEHVSRSSEPGHVASEDTGRIESATDASPSETPSADLNNLSLEDLTKLAEAGDVGAQSRLGYRYAQGIGTPIDDAKAFYWIGKAAEQGRAVDQFNLSIMYEYGTGIPVDAAAAALWLERAAVQGLIEAQLALGDKYAKGSGVPRNDTKAVEWYRKAADQGNSTAQQRLGEAHLYGLGVPKNIEAAVALYQLAANQGDAIAQVRLGAAYHFGTGIPKDFQLAAKWYQRAAEQGSHGAQNNLGNLYEAGDGVPRDYQQAYFWYLLASVGGLEPAIANRDRLERRLTPQQVAAAQRDASAWKPTRPTN